MRFATPTTSLIWLLFACRPVWSAALPTADLDLEYSESHLPPQRLSPEEVQAMKDEQVYPSGHILSYATLPVDPNSKSNGTRLVPVRQGDPDILLDNEVGVQARSLFARQGSSCIVWGAISGSCAITYCWSDVYGNIKTAHLTITGSNGRSNPESITSSNTNIMTNWEYTSGWGQWFNGGHECSNSNTQLVTLHRVSDPGNPHYHANAWRATVDHLQCNNCRFRNVECEESLVGNLLAFTNGSGTGTRCEGDPNDEL